MTQLRSKKDVEKAAKKLEELLSNTKNIENPLCRECRGLKERYDKCLNQGDSMLGLIKDLRKKQLILKDRLIGVHLMLYKFNKEKEEDVLKAIRHCYIYCEQNMHYTK